MGVRTGNDKVTAGERAFMLASIKKALSDGDTPLKCRNFGSGKKSNAGGEA